MAEGILLFAGDNVWSQELDRKKKYWVHGVLLFVGTVFLTAGIVLEIDIKGNRRHFTSNHGLTGKIRSKKFLKMVKIETDKYTREFLPESSF